MKQLAYLLRSGPAFDEPRRSRRRSKIPRVAQRTLFPIREGLHATPEAWEKFAERARRDGVTIGQIFRAVIYGYAEGKTSLKLPPDLPPGKS